MQPVQGGFETHRIRGDGDYEAKKRAAIAQAQQNSYMQGVQEVFNDGVGQSIKDSRSQYGNVNLMPQQLLQGADSNFQYRDTPGNQVLNDPVNQTGTQELQQSATRTTQADPEVFETDALEKRLATMAKGGMHNLNDVPNLYRRG